MKKHTKNRAIVSLIIAAALFLTACAGIASNAEGGGIVTLYIGYEGENPVSVAVEGPWAPETLIKALAEETGWNLDLASIYSDASGVVIALASESSLYMGPPEPQKDAYHVYDGEDLVSSIIFSIANTLIYNDFSPVYFTAPEGGDIVAETSGYAFLISAEQPWGEPLSSLDIYLANVAEFVTPFLALDYAGHAYSEEITNDYAANYLVDYANRFYAANAETYPDIQSDYSQYISFPQDDVTQFLNVAFGSKFGTDELSPASLEDQRVIYNAKAYYIASDILQTDIELTPSLYESDYEIEYTYTLTYPGIVKDGTIRVILEPSAENQLGVSIASFKILN
jgi:hypothetical protein